MGFDDKVEAKVDELKGSVKEKVGRHTDDPSLEAEGHLDQAKGNAKEAWESTKDALRR